MTTKKQASKKKPTRQETGPVASRPRMEGYGVPKDKKGLLPWSHVTGRMEKTMHYWVCTVSSDNRPHATPVDGLWIDDKLFFGGSPTTKRNRNLAQNPAVCIHLEDGMDVVILHGDALEERVDHAMAVRLAEDSAKKYGYGMPPEQYESMGVHVFRPRLVLAWKQFPKDATRFQFPDGD